MVTIAGDIAVLKNTSSRVRVESQLRSWIDEGQLKPGDALPSERELSTRLGANRNAVRWALSMLHREGKLVAKGPRTRVVAEPSAGSASGIGLMQDTVVIISGSTNTDVITTDPKQLGWAEAVEDSIRCEVDRLGFHYMVLHPKKMTGQTLEHLAHANPAGLIVPDLFADIKYCIESVRMLKANGVKVVVYGSQPEFEGLDRVTSDHEAGAYELTRWMIAQGRRRILMLWDDDVAKAYWYPARRQGYERAMREAGLEPLPTFQVHPFAFIDNPTREQFMDEARKQVGYLIEFLLPEQKVDAILCLSDGVVYRVSQAIRLCGKEPAKDVLVGGYDNYALAMKEREYLPIVPQATVDKQHWLIGQSLVQLLMARVAGTVPAEPQCRVIAPRLVVL